MSGFVYFIGPEALLQRPQLSEGAVVKIGFTKQDPHARLKTLQTGSPLHLVLWAYVAGGADLEKALHRTFGPLGSHGESFYTVGKLAALLCYLGDEPFIGRLIPESEFADAVSDNVFSDFAPHPSIDDQDWVDSATPSELKSFFPEEWSEAYQ